MLQRDHFLETHTHTKSRDEFQGPALITRDQNCCTSDSQESSKKMSAHVFKELFVLDLISQLFRQERLNF